MARAGQHAREDEQRIKDTAQGRASTLRPWPRTGQSPCRLAGSLSGASFSWGWRLASGGHLQVCGVRIPRAPRSFSYVRRSGSPLEATSHFGSKGPHLTRVSAAVGTAVSSGAPCNPHSWGAPRQASPDETCWIPGIRRKNQEGEKAHRPIWPAPRVPAEST